MRRVANFSASFLLCLFVTFFMLYKLGYPLAGIDDANIYFVYARNLANGYGFVYNIGGERVEGFTSLLWTIISAFAFKFTTLPEITLLIVNILLISLGIACVMDYLQQTSAAKGNSGKAGLFWSAVFLVIIFSSPRYIVWNTISLMENALWSTLLVLTTLFDIKDHSSSAAIHAGFLPLGILLLLTRPESFLWVVVFLGVLFIRFTFTGGIAFALKRLAPSIAGILLTAILFTIFRLQYFGYPLPNTYYAKVSPSLAYNLQEGLLYLVRYFISDPIASISVMAVLLACIYSLLRPAPGRGEFYLPFLAAIGLLVPVLIGGDHFGSFRFYQSVYPITVLCLIYSIRDILPDLVGERIHERFPSRVRAMIFPGLALLLFLGFGSSQGKAWSRFPPEIQTEFDLVLYERSNGTFIQDLFSSLPRLPSVGVIAAGGIKYSYGGEIVDLVGLNNTAMAHNHGDRIGYHGHAAFEASTFYLLQPEILMPFMVNDSWQYSEKELRENWENKLAFNGLYDEPRFLDLYQYAKVGDAAPDRYNLALVGWFRKDFLERLRMNVEFSIEQFNYDS